VSLAAEHPGAAPSSREPAAVVAERVHGKPGPREIVYEGLVTRGIAFSVDAALINLIAFVVAVAVGLSLSVLHLPGGVMTAIVAVGGAAYLVWIAAYFVTFWSTTGQTPGNRLLRIRVCRADGGDALRPRGALLRLVALTLAALPLFAGFLPILVDDRRRGLHDMIADTVVVAAETFVSHSQNTAPMRVAKTP
jgi:uncharacterized RDD family membrane protein YckC